jgi:hypothetical protein
MAEPMKAKPLKQSYKTMSSGAFTIQLLFQGVGVDRTVNDLMHLRVLFNTAHSYLRNDFGFTVTDIEVFDLSYENQILLCRGALGDVQVLDQAIIEIVYPRLQENPTARGYRHSPPSVASPRPNREPQANFPTRNIPKIGEDKTDEFQGSSPNSLDSRSYDKIRQSIKCPRFSGQAREWKQWDKGFFAVPFHLGTRLCAGSIFL